MAGKRMALLYVGQNKSESYAEYTEDDIKALSNATEFVIVPGTYEGYLSNVDKDGNIVSFEDVAQKMVTLATRIKRWTGKHVWFGTPTVPTPGKKIKMAEYNTYASQIKTCISDLKTKFNLWVGETDAFEKYVDGIYLNHEHILVPGDDPDYGENLTASNPTAHPQVAMLNTIASYVHNTLGKKTLWIPYYGRGGNWNNTIYSIGVLANKTNIFDYVIMQPSYYFNPGTSNGVDVNVDNLYAVRESITLNKVVGRPSAYSVVTGNKTSNTKIGAEMEMDMHYTESGCSTRFAKYMDCFNNTGSLTSKSKHSDYKKSNYDFAFYLDAKYADTDAAEFKARLKKVNDFFSD